MTDTRDAAPAPQPASLPAHKQGPEPAARRHAPEPSRELRERFRDGDPDAIDELAAAFFDDAERFCMAFLRGDPELASDATQEAFLRVLERHRLFDPRREFRPWFFKVCRNCCLELRRRRLNQAARVVELEPDAEEIDRLAATAPAAVEALVRGEREAEALRLLSALPEQKRTIVLLHLFEELTFREIAEIAGRPANTVASIYYRALDELREIAGPALPEFAAESAAEEAARPPQPRRPGHHAS